MVGNVPFLSSFLKKHALNQTQMKRSLSIGELGFVAEKIYLGLITANSFQKLGIQHSNCFVEFLEVKNTYPSSQTDAISS